TNVAAGWYSGFASAFCRNPSTAWANGDFIGSRARRPPHGSRSAPLSRASPCGRTGVPVQATSLIGSSFGRWGQDRRVEFSDVVRRRRMVRQFAQRPVQREVLERILDTARRGPSAGFSQGFEFVVLDAPEQVKACWTVTADPDFH